MGRKSSAQRESFFYPLSANREVPMFNLIGKFPRVIFFSPNRNKFAIERDWNTEISQNVPKLAFLEKKIVFFLKLFFKIGKGGKFAVECASIDFFQMSFRFE